MPQRDANAFLLDVVSACDAVAEFIRGADVGAYATDLKLRSAVERQLLIAGEAVNNIRRLDPMLAGTLGDVKGIVDFRNILIHGYFHVKHEVVWAIASTDAPRLRAAAHAALDDPWKRTT